MRTGLIIKIIIAVLITGVSMETYAELPQIDEEPIDARAAGDIQSRTNNERLTVLTNELMGDHIDLDTGNLSLSNTDISIPGNSALPVQFGRSLNRSRMSDLREGWMGDWSPDIPHIKRRYLHNFEPPHTEDVPRCTVGGQGHVTSFWKSFQPETYWQGMNLVGFSNASKYMLRRRTNENNPELAGKTPKYLTQDYWLIDCIDTNTPSDEGYRATAPNGDIYTFDHTVAFDGGLAYPSDVSPDSNSLVNKDPVNTYNEFTFVTRIEDVHGNWVVYDYDVNGRPYKITSNDGRQIDIGWTGDQITSATSVDAEDSTKNRVWNYAYGACSGTDCRKLLTVTLPDNQTWSYSGTANISGVANSSALCLGDPGGTATITHPSGTTAIFNFEVISNGRTNLAVDYLPSSWGLSPHDRCFAGAVNNPRSFNSMAVTEKTLTISGSPNATWLYEYEQDEGQYFGEANLNPPSPGAIPPYPDLLPTKWREVTQPDGTKIRTHLNRAYGYEEGKVMQVQTISDSGAIIDTQTYEYEQGDNVGSRTHGHYNAITSAKTHIVSKIKSETQRDGDTYTSESSYEQDTASASYSYGFPIETRVYSDIDGFTAPRQAITTYEHDTAKWILGLPATISQQDSVAGGAQRLIYGYTYNAFGQKIAQTRFGQPYVTFGYHTDPDYAGKIKWVKDALNRETQALNWKRGTAQEVLRPDAISEHQTVDNNGWLTSQTDARGYTTSYEHDTMGRLTLIDPPSTWDNTSIVYDFSGGGAVQTITKGQSKQTITYDSLFRPILEHQQDLSSTWSSYVNTTYDSLGRPVFQSQPSINSAETKGTNTEYDALGRVTSIAENVAPFATTLTSYHSGNRKRVTDPSGAWADYIASGYDGPGGDDVRLIYRGEGVDTYLQQTDITKNIWGEMTQLRQWGDLNGHAVDHSQYFYYDPITHRLCRHYAPEHGATLYEYDDAGQMTAYAKGQPNSGCTVPTNNSRVNAIYDNLGRVETTNFNDPNTPDIVRSYDNNGNVLTVNRGSSTGAVNWTYSYNEMNMPTSEHLTLDSIAFDIDYSYNTAGQLTSKFLPSGRQITYTPDGLGRDKTIATGNLTLASNVWYHPSGAVSTMLYGNGQQFTQTLNDRLLPAQMLSTGNGITALDQSYTYDSRGKITDITDGAVTGNSRSYTYDGLGQLSSGTSGSWWGTLANDYDSLGNLRAKVLPYRSLTTVYDTAANRIAQSIDSFAAPRGFGTRAIGYDTRGNVTSIGLTTFVYDMSDQPVVVSGQTAAGAPTNGNYVYDGNLKRVKAVVNGQTHYNVYDLGGRLVHIHALNDNKITEYVSGPKGSLARITNDAVTYLHADHLGTAQAGTDENGALEWRQHYTPFGYALTSPAANDNLAGFTGHIKDKATGLNYMQARYYDPTIGRFLSVDPVTFMDTGDPNMFNRYAYSYNDPINMLDNDGRKPEHVQDRVSHGVRAARQNPESGIRVALGAMAISAAVAGTGAACVGGGCAALAPAATATWNASNATTAGMTIAAGAIAGSGTAVSGGDAKQIATSTTGAMLTTLAVIKSPAAFQKFVAGLGGGTTTAATTDLIDGQQDQSDSSYFASGLVTAISALIPGPPVLVSAGGTATDNEIQEVLNDDENKNR